MIQMSCLVLCFATSVADISFISADSAIFVDIVQRGTKGGSPEKFLRGCFQVEERGMNHAPGI